MGQVATNSPCCFSASCKHNKQIRFRLSKTNPIFREIMLEIPGKDCGSCSFCCQVLEIEELNKKAGDLCGHCSASGGCSVYATRPQVCRDYYCDWKDDRGLNAQFRPDRIGTLLMEDPDSDEYHAVCDPGKPFSWRNPLIFKHLVNLAKEGRMVVAKAGLRAWRIFPDGRFQETA
jgi:hypothetical protein